MGRKKNSVSETKKFSEQNVTKPEQLTLFQLFNESRDDYSHTFKLYSVIPSKVYHKVERIQGQFLENIEREFVYEKTTYKLKLTPARLEDADGRARDAYMGKREEVVEDALLKMAADGRRANAVYLDNQFTVIFSRKALQDELKEQGHYYSYAQIEEAIDVLYKTSIELYKKGEDDSADKFHPIAAYGFRGQMGEKYTYVKFSPQVTAAIENNTFRLVNYKKLMAYETTIARLLHKKLANSFVYADIDQTYHFSSNSIYRDFGLKETQLKVKVFYIKKALEELIQANVVLEYEVKPVFDSARKNKLCDQVFDIIAHRDFIDEVVKANKDVKRRERELSLRKYLPEISGILTKK